MRTRLRKKVAFSPPSPPARRGGTFSAHGLACHQDLLFSICTAKAANLAMERSLFWTFHDDGSLTSRDIALLCHHFPGSRIVRRAEADAALEAMPDIDSHLKEMRARHLMLVKLADLYVYSESPRILYIDSDVLFVRTPTFLLNCLERTGGANYFNRDIDSCYITSRENIRELTGHLPPDRINAGLSALNRTDISLDRIASVLRQLHPSRRSDWSFYGHLIEQTCVALLAATSSAGYAYLPDEYNVSLAADITRNTTQHYVGKIRHRYEMEGLKFLLSHGQFIDRWARFTRNES
ncbi:hypothetical protein [Horticoccus sp. 23ND18S-11]|uniref:hypothetical protein n=1 Tax=Horticoccus sp. 23ND18S-11 TaxID=3391832 RepID=UPI0039C8C183